MSRALQVASVLAAAFASAGASAETLPGCAEAIAYSAQHKGESLLVLRDAQVVCASGDVDSPHEIWSGTKSLAGLIAAAAVQDKLLTLDEKAADTLTEWRGDPRKSGITIRHLLSMTGGQPSAVGRPQGYADSVEIPLAADPGTRFQYGPAPLQIFGEILRRKLTGAHQEPSPRAYAERRILQPIGVTIAEWREGPDGNPLMPQGLVLAAKEWARIGEFVRAGGKHNGEAIVDAAAFAELFKGSSANPAYGLTWWLPRPSASNDPVTRTVDIIDPAANLPSDMVVAAGAGDQRLYVIPSLKLTIVRQAKLDIAAMLAARQGDNWSDTRLLKLLLDK